MVSKKLLFLFILYECIHIVNTCSLVYDVTTGLPDTACSFCPSGTVGIPQYGCQQCPTNHYSFNGLVGTDCAPCSSGTLLRTPSNDTCIPSTFTNGLVYYFSADVDEELWAYRTYRKDLLSYVPDRFGRQGRALRTLGGYIYAPCSPKSLPSGNAPRTLAVWVKMPTVTVDYQATIAGYGMADTNMWFGITHLGPTDSHGHQLMLNWMGGFLLSGVSVDDDKWHLITVTHNGLHTKLFVDGVSVAEISRTYNTIIGCQGDGDRWSAKLGPFIFFGHISLPNYQLLNGTIDEIRIYSRALQSSEVYSLFSETLPSPSSTPAATVSPTASPSTSALCLAGTFSFSGTVPCTPCPPGTYSNVIGARNCILCPAGTFGDHAGLSTSACSGSCPSCTDGSTIGSTSSTTLTCSSSSVRAIPSSLGLQIWPAAHPSNVQKVDLVIAPLSECIQYLSTSLCNSATTFIGSDSITRYVTGTAASLNMEPAEMVQCIN